jgi:Skp family chaperone for outer membrane proteins
MTSPEQGVLTVKTILYGGAVCSLLLSLTAATCHAQAVPGTRVVVIDISKVFDSHARFKQNMEAMKQEVQAFEATLRKRGEEIQTIQNEMKQFQPGSAEYKQREEQIMKIQADGQIAATQKKKEFLDREAQVYFGVYQEIVNEVEAFANENGIAIVIRFNSEEIKQDRNAVLEGINRAVVYQSKSNITNAIIERLVRKDATVNGTASAMPGALQR